MANLYTKTGDRGQTALVGGSRTSKDNPRVACYGTIDEANSMLGLAYTLSENQYVRETIHGIQEKLFVLGAELASDEKGMKALGNNILQDRDVKDLEKIVDHCTETTGKQTAFVVPGVNEVSSALHVARTIVRRGERVIIAARKTEEMRDLPGQYVNRLSDAIYALARLEETLHERKSLREQIKDAVKQKLSQEKSFTLQTIKQLAELAEQKAAEMKAPVVFSAVDAGGNLILLHRMEGSLLGSIELSMNKAYTANAFKLATDQLAKSAQPGKDLYGIQNDKRIVIFGGGYPYMVNGQAVGAIGISGGTVSQDMEIAEYALKEIGGMK